jgi:hypothetical protein
VVRPKHADLTTRGTRQGDEDENGIPGSPAGEGREPNFLFRLTILVKVIISHNLHLRLAMPSVDLMYILITLSIYNFIMITASGVLQQWKGTGSGWPSWL